MPTTQQEMRFREIRDTMSHDQPDRNVAAALIVLAETIKSVACQTHDHVVKIPGLNNLIVENR